MKIFFFLVIILVSGEITYKKTIKFPIPKTKTVYYEKELKSINNSLDKLKYELKFNSTISYFDLEKSMSLDIEKIHRKAISKGKGKESFYTDIKTKTCIEINKLGGETFLVHNLKPNFELSKETKIINGYTCYKATTSETAHLSKLNIGMKDEINEIIAWYTMEVPIQFGPLNFFGLPGLILELQYSNTTYTVVDMNFSNKSIEINKPFKGKKVTAEEFEELIIETMKKMNIGLD